MALGAAAPQADGRARRATRDHAPPWWNWPGRAAGLACAVVVVLLVTLLCPARAQAAGLLIADGGLGGQLEIKEQDVRVVINNGIAVTHVTQVFRNTESRVVEALYTFPVPRSASVANFSMWINGKEMVGEVVEKQRARQIYESYKAVRRDPGLLEQKDYRTFEMRVFPIPAGAEQKVQVSYYQELDVDHDVATYVYPLATQTVSSARASSTVSGKFSMNVDAKSEVPISSVTSPSHGEEVAIAKRSEGYWQASLETRQGDLNRDVVLTYKLARPRTGLDLIASRQAGEDGYFCLTLMTGQDAPAKEQPVDYVFIVDISGSMNDGGKLPLSARAVESMLATLSPQDRFEVLAFNVQTLPLFRQLSDATPENRAQATAFIAQQHAAGGTALRPAVQAGCAYATGERQLNVVILSDGLTEPGDHAALLEALGQRKANTRAFCIGVGNDIDRALLEQLAQKTGGVAAFISARDDLQRLAQSFRRKIARPVASDVVVDFGATRVSDLEPAKLPDLFYGSPVRLYGRYQGSGPAKVTLRANIAGKPFSQELTLDLPEREAGNTEIERMWAWRRMDRLLKEADASGSRPSAAAEIVRLGEGYSIASEYTSFIVLENDAEYRRWNIERKNSLRLDRDRGQQAAIQQQLEALRAKAQANIGPVPANSLASAAPVVSAQNDAPASAAQPTPVAAPAGNPPAPQPQNPNGRNWDLPNFGGGGGGALDPFTAAGAVALAASVLAAKRRRTAA
ncbi:MAG: VIT and VWA domain-containing protein [Planctomycetota bacterium]|nr:VIT and VWA domain-containing protein [Planctomycetota bacterium]